MHSTLGKGNGVPEILKHSNWASTLLEFLRKQIGTLHQIYCYQFTLYE